MLNLIWLFNPNFAFQSSRTPSDCNYTFLYLSILDVSRYLLIYNHLRLFKTFPHEFFTDVSIVEENGIQCLKALFKGKKPISERVLKLDAERYQKGDLPLANLLSKYCSYMVAGNRE